MQLFDIKSNAQDAIEKFIVGNEIFMVKMRTGLNAIVELYAQSIWNNARKQSYGPRDPTKLLDTGDAFTVPVRRISSDYYDGWKIKRIGMGVFYVYNASREAYFIEYGINPTSKHVPVRRPILKMALLKTVDEMAELPGMLAAESWVSEGGASFTVTENYSMGEGALFSAGSAAEGLGAEG